jgi:tRNA U55 pseudouridine synthase TruB
MDKSGKSDYLKDFDGIILINKPPAVTSFDIIRKLKKVFF